MIIKIANYKNLTPEFIMKTFSKMKPGSIFWYHRHQNNGIAICVRLSSFIDGRTYGPYFAQNEKDIGKLDLSKQTFAGMAQEIAANPDVKFYQLWLPEKSLTKIERFLNS
jgi:hypothetical protein